mmetsp:Transcript_23149/g.24087  ORF Transcript_23149/g.24087 Transcript_23149/m.24087 type:complete len:427 (+) Transcript_23149:1-1281(+)
MKFLTIKGITKTALIFAILFTITNTKETNQNLAKKKNLKEPPIERKNPNARDVAMEAIVQNTAYTAGMNQAYRGEVDKHPDRYQILGSVYNESNFGKTSKNKYAKDPEAYYPYVDPTKHQTQTMDQTRMDRNPVYELDKKAYYNPTGLFKVVPNKKIGKEIPIVMGDLDTSFPTEKNLDNLKGQLNSIRQQDNMDLNTASMKGIYVKDPHAYYDPTIEDTVNTVKDIHSKIMNMEFSLNNDAGRRIQARIGTEKIHPQIQNQTNRDAEERNRIIGENYYTPLAKENGYTVELPVGNPIGKKQRKPPVVASEKIPAEEIEHHLEEATLKADSTNESNSTQSNTQGNTEANSTEGATESKRSYYDGAKENEFRMENLAKSDSHVNDFKAGKKSNSRSKPNHLDEVSKKVMDNAKSIGFAKRISTKSMK